MASLDDVSPRSICPFLGVLDEEGRSAPYVDYPSFENLCFVADRPDAIMLTDQATFCLSSGHRHCPRLMTAGGRKRDPSRNSSNGESSVSPFASETADPLMHAMAEMEAALEARHITRTRRRRRWGRFGALMIFLSCLLCGGMAAAYIGWQMVNTNAVTTQAGTVTNLASAATQAPPPVYLIVTATSDPPQQPGASTRPLQAHSQGFPPAVTATPYPAASDRGQQPIPGTAAGQALNGIAAQPAQGVAPDETDLATPSFNMLVQIPTRRPTPFLDLAITIPTLTQATPVPSPSPSPSPALGTPVVVFAADDAALESGECTTVTWHVENVRAVYYENLGVDGHGEHEECIRDKPGDYTLTVVLPNGGTEYYTVTVGMVLPTETPSPTATYPPEVVPTATWTPVVPTETPTPDMQYGALLTVVDGTQQDCASGKTCEIGVLVTNTSLGIDDLSIRFLQTGAWSAKLCRLDGVCSDSRLTLASVGPGNTALVNLLVEAPKRAAGMTVTYVVRAVSERSEDGAGSDAVTIKIAGT